MSFSSDLLSDMENLTGNVTFVDKLEKTCEYVPGYKAILSLIDIVAVLVGQPLITKVLWISSTTKKMMDILNFNMALFHNLQYLLSVVHLIVLFAWSPLQMNILETVLMYAQIGGPMSLSFICMERFIAVVYPMSYPLLKKYRIREICSVAAWLITVPCALLAALSTENTGESQGFKFFPYVVLTIMTMMVTRSSIIVARTLKRCGPGRDKLHPTKKKAFKTVCATSCIALFCYAPVAVLQNLTTGNKTTYLCVTAPLSVFLLTVASVVHPLFYLYAHGKLFTCSRREKKAR